MNPVARPLAGSGVLARTGDLLLLCAPGGPTVDDLLDAFADVAAAGGDGALLVRRIAALLANDLDARFPACAAYGPTSDGRGAVLVNGSATASITGADGVVALSAADAVTAVNRIVTGPIDEIRLALPDAGEPDARLRLDSGVIAAGGVVATVHAGVTPTRSRPSTVDAAGVVPSPAAAPAPAYPAAPAPAYPAAPAPAYPAADPLPARPATVFPQPPPPPFVPPQAPPVPNPPAQPETPLDHAAGGPAVGDQASGHDGGPTGATPDHRPRVLGVFCPTGHFIDPSLSYCPVCGVTMAQHTAVPQEGPRPSLGVLIVDDGTAVDVDADYLIGREPQHDPDVVAGLARSLKIVDSEGVVSRKHARVTLEGWDVRLTDLGSANGTWIQPPGAPERQQLAADTPVVIRPGTVITLGRRSVVYESPRMP